MLVDNATIEKVCSAACSIRSLNSAIVFSAVFVISMAIKFVSIFGFSSVENSHSVVQGRTDRIAKYARSLEAK